MPEQPLSLEEAAWMERRIFWACRRGMRELDVLLLRFLSGGEPALAPEEYADFYQFLQEDDVQLYAWCIGSAVPPPAAAPWIVRILGAHDPRPIS